MSSKSIEFSKPPTVTFFRNGDKYNEGIKIVLHKKKFTTMDRIKIFLDQNFGIITSQLRSIYHVTLNRPEPEKKTKEMETETKGDDNPFLQQISPSHVQQSNTATPMPIYKFELVNNVNDFVDGGFYIATGAEKVERNEIPVNLKKALMGVMNNENQTTEMKTQKPKTPNPTPTPSEARTKAFLDKHVPAKSKVIYVFKNMDKYFNGKRLVIESKKIRTMDQLKQFFTESVGIETGSVRSVFTIFGKPISSLDEIEDGGKYIVCGGEKLNSDKRMMPKNLLDLLNRNSEVQTTSA